MLEDLPVRQIVIMELLIMGGSNDDIADVLRISPHTVKVHLWRIFNRLGVNSRTEAIALWRNAQMELEQPNLDKLQEANAAMLSALQWLAANRHADPIAITGVLSTAIAAGEWKAGA